MKNITYSKNEDYTWHYFDSDTGKEYTANEVREFKKRETVKWNKIESFRRFSRIRERLQKGKEMGYTYKYDDDNKTWHYYDLDGKELTTTEVSNIISRGNMVQFSPAPKIENNKFYGNEGIGIQKGETIMPAFQVVVSQKVVKKVDSAGNEMTTVDRILVDKRIHAQNPYGAAVIAGMELDKASTDVEVLASITTTITVNQTN